jgi:hypothetical protein
MHRRTFVLASIATLCLPLNPARAAALGVGATLPQMTLDNQHGVPQAFPGAGTRFILFAVEKAPSDEVNAYLTDIGADAMRRHGIVFVADISGMPAFVTQNFALPKMRKRPYDILLVTHAEQAAFMPREKDAVTLLRVDQGKITGIGFERNALAIKAAIGPV